MKTVLRPLAFIYGFFLMYFVCIWFTGFMAARQISREYFRFFATYGAAGKEAAHAVLNIALHLFPTVLLLGAGVFLATKVSSEGSRTIGLATILGGAASYVFWLIYFSTQDQDQAWSLSAALASYIQAPWWAWPAIAAPILGLVCAYSILPKHPHGRTGA